MSSLDLVQSISIKAVSSVPAPWQHHSYIIPKHTAEHETFYHSCFALLHWFPAWGWITQIG